MRNALQFWKYERNLYMYKQTACIFEQHPVQNDKIYGKIDNEKNVTWSNQCS